MRESCIQACSMQVRVVLVALSLQWNLPGSSGEWLPAPCSLLAGAAVLAAPCSSVSQSC